MSGHDLRTSSPLGLFDFLTGVRINLQAILRVAMSVDEESDDENRNGNDDNDKPFHLTV